MITRSVLVTAVFVSSCCMRSPTYPESVAAVPPVAPVPPGTWWKPGTLRSFQIFHFDGLPDFKSKLRPGIEVVTLELEQIERAGGAAVVDHAHANGTRVVCYTSQGYEERYRIDWREFPVDAKRNPMADWDGERWADPRSDSLLAFQGKRMDRCKQLGADAIELDNMDQHGNTKESGVDITLEGNVAAQKRFAELAHSKGLAIMAKNGPDAASGLASVYDGVWVESCMAYKADHECDKYAAYQGKPVIMVEYADDCYASSWSTCQEKCGYFEE